MDELYRILDMINPLDGGAMAAARRRQDTLTKPPGSLGRLEEISIQLAGIQARPIPRVKDKGLIVMAGDHGVVAEKVGNWPQSVTTQMVLNFLGGGAAISVLARHSGLRMVVVDMGVASNLDSNPGLVSRRIAAGTQNMVLGPAMSRDQALASILCGVNILSDEVKRGLDIVGTGDMGIGNTTPSAAICAVMSGKPASEVTGRGTGIDDAQLAHKIDVVSRALSLNHPDPADPLDVLAKVGGFEIGGLAGVMLAAAANRVPVVIDGFISGAAALIAAALSPRLKDYLFAAHMSAERGHAAVLERLGLKPLLDLGMRLGEGSGAALGIFIIEAAAKIMSEMATFSEAGVSERT